MAELLIPDLDEEAARHLEKRASRNGRRLEAEARAILEEAAAEGGFAETAGGEAEAFPPTDEKGLGDLMYERFKDIGLRADEVQRFNMGIAAANSRWEMSLPDFEADQYEEGPAQK